MKISPLAPALPVLLLACMSWNLRGSVIVDSLHWYTSSTSSTLTAAADATLDPSSSVLSSNSGGAVVLATLPSALVVTSSSPVTLSFSFRDVGLDGFKVGLFNDGGTAGGASGDGTAVNTQTTDDIGSFLTLTQTSFQTVMETAPASLFYGTRTTGTSTSYSSVSGLGFSTLGSGVHQFTMTISLSGITYTMQYKLDGVILGSSTTTDPNMASIDEIGISASPMNVEMGQIAAVPEPPAGALLGAAGLAWAWARTRAGRRTGKIPA